ncbi:MAG: 2Fe-2S iron-sulfur cluster-binding protein [Spirochaetaceae bacterium]|nr:2Fe-2S iron-sulfur cluster-binding protein [Spirochaetaceae bacterium]
MTIDFVLNGKPQKTQIRSGDRLVYVLQKLGDFPSLIPDCLGGNCGRCLVFMDGRLIYSCLTPAFKAKGSSIVTYEGFSATEDCKDIIYGLKQASAFPCNFCRKAKIMMIADLLKRIPLPEETDIMEQMSIVSCPCTDPVSLAKAVLLSAECRNKRKFKRADK